MVFGLFRAKKSEVRETPTPQTPSFQSTHEAKTHENTTHEVHGLSHRDTLQDAGTQHSPGLGVSAQGCNASSSREPSTDSIAQRAFEIWDAKGRPAGSELEDWLEAEHQLRLEYHASRSCNSHKTR